jgi:hypothetical protein
MACHRIRIALLLGTVAAFAAPLRAEDAPKATGPTMRTIQVTECVPERYEVKRTCYRMECKTETVQGFRYETVCVPRERVCTTVERIPETKTVTKRVCHYESCCETRTVMKNCYHWEQYTCMQKKCVSRGHWECCETCKQPGCLEKLHNPCACPHTVCQKHWVHCPVYEECPVTKCRKVCTQVPTTCQVRVCKPVWTEQQCQVCTYRCVEKQHVEKYNVQECRKVACQVTRTVQVCVPYTVTEVCCRMVPHVVTRQVPVCEAPCCPEPCCQTQCCCKPQRCHHTRCSSPCSDSCGRTRCGGLHHRQRDCCDSCCH